MKNHFLNFVIFNNRRVRAQKLRFAHINGHGNARFIFSQSITQATSYISADFRQNRDIKQKLILKRSFKSEL